MLSILALRWASACAGVVESVHDVRGSLSAPGGGEGAVAQPPSPAPPDTSALLRRSLAALRAEHERTIRRLGEALDAAERRGGELETERDAALAECRAAKHAAGAANARAEAAEARANEAMAALRKIEASTCWRATAWPRRMVGQLRDQG